VDFVPADRQGNLDYSAFARLLRPNTRAVLATHASNLTGNLLDLGFVGGFAASHGLPLLLDAAQTAGSFPIDMQKQHIAVLCFTGHKGLMGPQGTGGLCIAPGISIRPLMQGGTGVRSYEEQQPEEYPEHLEAGTLNTPGLAGLAAAVDFLQGTGLAAIHAQELALTRRFRQAVSGLPGAVVYGDFSGDRAPIVALNLRGWPSAQLADALAQRYDIAVRAGAHCAPRMHRALGTEKTGAVRFSFGWFNTAAQIDASAAALAELAEEPVCLK
jgi:selenocysteine lyase/cysteine desulfurase